MNKDVIYIEPEDDITDIITKIKNSKEKIVAVVPPKKASVFRSIVNIKLITKSGQAAGKTVVLVTTDPAIVKLAATTKLPVTKNLQSAPSVPVAEEIAKEIKPEEKASEETEEVAPAEDEAKEEAETETPAETEESSEVGQVSKKGFFGRKNKKIESVAAIEAKIESENPEDAEEAAEKEQETAENDAKKTKLEHKDKVLSSNPVIAWLQTHKAIAIGCCCGLVGVILVLIWAFTIAPAATVTVGIRTTTSNFSENVTFVNTATEENAASGKFYQMEKKDEAKAEVEFTATGKKDVGARASGEVVVYTYFRREGAVAVNAGSTFTNSGLTYVSQKDVTLSWGGTDQSKCDNNGQASAITSGCLISARVPVTAETPGSKYNIAANDTGWGTTANVAVYSDKAMAGGTDEVVTVVQQSDIDAAKEKLLASSDNKDLKAKLLAAIPEGNIAIESSFKETISDPVSIPAIGEKVEGDTKPKLSVITTVSIYYANETKLADFIREKAKLADNFKIYTMNDPFVENYVRSETGGTGKIKTSYVSGPEVTEDSVIEVVKGKGVGTAQHDLSEINGIGKIKIETSYPWVSTIPNDIKKITVHIDMEEQQ